MQALLCLPLSLATATACAKQRLSWASLQKGPAAGSTFARPYCQPIMYTLLHIHAHIYKCIYLYLSIYPGPSKRNIFLLITLFWLILPIERNFRNLRGNCKFHVPHPFCGKSCKFGHQKCAEIGGKCAEIGGKCAEIGGKCAEIGGKPKTNLF